MAREYRPLCAPQSLGDRLLEAGLITRTQLDVALDHQAAARGGRQRLGRILVHLGFLTERELTGLLSVHFGIPVAPFSIAEAEERAVTSVPAGVARRHRAAPCRIVSGCLLVAVADAPTPDAVAELQAVSGRPVLLYLGSEVDVDVALLSHYGRGSIMSQRLRALADGLERLADGRARLAPLLAAAEAATEDLAESDDDLRAELERLRRDLDAVLGAFREIADRLRDPSQVEALGRFD